MMLARSDARSIPLADGSVQCIVTSPPYWGLRDYGLATWDGGEAECDHLSLPKNTQAGFNERYTGKPPKDKDKQGELRVPYRGTCGKCGATQKAAGIGLEPTLDGYIENMRAVGRELWRVLRDDGVLWMNLGDCYANNASTTKIPRDKQGNGSGAFRIPDEKHVRARRQSPNRLTAMRRNGLKHKDLIGLPWRVAFALQEQGWYLRSDIIWAKPNPMPESVRDRPTRSHEYIFLLTKRARYFYDGEAVKEPQSEAAMEKYREWERHGRTNKGKSNGVAEWSSRKTVLVGGRNRRTVWTIPTQPYKGAHFATFPEKLVEPCILAGTSPKACGLCGAPWERVVEKSRTFESGSGKSGNMPVGKNGASMQGGGETLDVRRGPVVHSKIIGWRPTCDHNDDTGKCLVLDPFAGSGTVGAVSLRFGRQFVGLDLSAPYLKLAQERINKIPLGMSL